MKVRHWTDPEISPILKIYFHRIHFNIILSLPPTSDHFPSSFHKKKKLPIFVSHPSYVFTVKNKYPPRTADTLQYLATPTGAFSVQEAMLKINENMKGDRVTQMRTEMTGLPDARVS
jgi:hypothetical protein